MKTFTLIVLTTYLTPIWSKTIKLESGENKVNLIELYTSENCSSCPPAQKWMNSFKEKPGLWKEFVPVEFHVSYWNYLPWLDRYSQDAYSKRHSVAFWVNEAKELTLIQATGSNL